MRQVFQIKVINDSQGVILPSDRSFRLNGSPLKNTWDRPEAKITGPDSMKPDYYINSISGLIFGDSVYQEINLMSLMEQSGEILELSHPRKRLFLLNITHYPEPLDEAKCAWEINPATKNRDILKTFQFFPDILPQVGLFKMNYDDQIYLATNSECNPDDDFYQLYHSLSLQGLGFKKIWTS